MNIFDLIKRHEGVRLKPYKDSAGKLTIGVGRNLEDLGISSAEADTLLLNDILRIKVQAYDSFSWFKDLSKVRKDVVLSMIFNLGLHGFMEFRKTISAITRKDFELASKEMMNSEWAAQVGPRAYELSEMMRIDQYLVEGKKYA
jgi:lysozyme